MKTTNQLLTGSATAQDLLEGRAYVAEQMRDIIRNAENEKRATTEDENARFNQFDADHRSLTEKLERQQKLEAMDAEKAARRDQGPTAGTEQSEEQEMRSAWNKQRTSGRKSLNESERKMADDLERKVFRHLLRFGQTGMDVADLQVVQQLRGTDPQASTPGARGGFTIPQGFSNELEIAMKYYGDMLNVCRIFRTDTGNQVDWPTVDDTAVKGKILTENTPMIVNDMTFGQKKLDAYLYTTDLVKVSVQLAQDTAFDLEAFILDQFANRLGRILNEHMTTGDGDGKPNGFVTAASVGHTASAVDAITRSDLIALQHSVDRAYRGNAIYQFNDATLAAIKKLSFGSGDARPLWQPSMREGTPDTLEGYGYSINNDMAALGAANKPVAFGDFNHYVIRLVNNMTFVPFFERFMDSFQFGYAMYIRADGELIQANAVKTLANAAS